MTLRQIAARLGREIGLSADDEQQYDALVDLVNDAAQELYEQTDLPRALLEETVETPCACVTRVTLPGRIGELRAIRDNFDKIRLHDMRPRYNSYPWPKGDSYVFRELRVTPLERSIDNAIGFYMDPIPSFEGDLEVSIAGRTNTTNEVHGTFDKNGEGSAQGILFEEVYYIQKNSVTPVDVILRSGTADGIEMARIYSHTERSRYIEIELIEKPQTCCTVPIQRPTRCFDILYKPPFRPLLEDTSAFQLEGYELPIVYKAVEIYRIRGIQGSATQEQILAATAHAKRADEVLDNKIKDRIQAKELMIQFGPPRGDIRLLRGLRARRYGRTMNPGWGRGYYS